jgi:hypothetical protein
LFVVVPDRISAKAAQTKAQSLGASARRKPESAAQRKRAERVQRGKLAEKAVDI